MNSQGNLPFITVVMPVLNEAAYIEQTLRQLIRQEYPVEKFEILVVDGMSTDSTQQIVRRLAMEIPQIQLLQNPKRRSSAGRNVGFMAGKGDYFLVIDGHCYIPDTQLFASVADCFGKSGADCLGRPQPLDPPGLTVFQQAVALARGSRLGHGGDSLIYGNYEGYSNPISNGAAYGRQVFEKVGYVDEQFDACEDVEFNFRVSKAGMTCYSSPRLTVKYYPRENVRGLFRQMVRYGKGRFRFINKHQAALSLNQLIPAGFVLGLLCLCVLFLTNLNFGLFLPLSLLYGAYFLAIIAESLRLAICNRWAFFWYFPGVFFTVHFGLGWGFLTSAVRYRSDRKASIQNVN